MAAPVTAATGDATATSVVASARYSAARPAGAAQPGRGSPENVGRGRQGLSKRERGGNRHQEPDQLREHEHGEERHPAGRQAAAEISSPVHERGQPRQQYRHHGSPEPMIQPWKARRDKKAWG